MAKSSISIIFVLLAITSTIAVAKPTAEAPAPAPAQDNFTNEFENGLFSVMDCWTSIKDVEHCAADIFKSVTSLKVSVSKECCNAISEVDGKCFSIFGSSFNSKLESCCYAHAAPPSSSPSA